MTDFEQLEAACDAVLRDSEYTDSELIERTLEAEVAEVMSVGEAFAYALSLVGSVSAMALLLTYIAAQTA